MPSIYITEFSETGLHSPGKSAVPKSTGYPVASDIARLPYVKTQVIQAGAASVLSAAFDPSTRFIRIHADTPCHVKVGSAPTATLNDMRLVTDSTEYFSVTPGHKLAVIQGS